MGKLISWIALALLLFVVPFVSWFYLQKGLEYRKNLEREVVAKDSVRITEDTLHLLRGKTSVISFAGTVGGDKVVEGILQQFKDVPRFQILSGGAVADNIAVPPGYFDALASRYAGKKYMLVDTSCRIRNIYMDNTEDIKKLVEHIAVVLPRKEEADIKIKK